eukprot:m.1637218 g.1637218  ORF g.1637218 m.1637218 type:complete len:450 (+) comp25600_c0_seq1:342-1691(+)
MGKSRALFGRVATPRLTKAILFFSLCIVAAFWTNTISIRPRPITANTDTNIEVNAEMFVVERDAHVDPFSTNAHLFPKVATSMSTHGVQHEHDTHSKDIQIEITHKKKADHVPKSPKNSGRMNTARKEKFSVQWADGTPRSIPHARLFGKAPGKRLYGSGTVLHFPTAVCMTTLPDRLGVREDGRNAVAESTIQDLVSQKSVSAIFLTIPMSHGHPGSKSKDHSSSVNQKVLPKWLSKYEEKVYIIRTDIDYGPSTRIIGCMFALPTEYENIITIEVDDDTGYFPSFAAGFAQYVSLNPEYAFSLSGFNRGSMVGEAGPMSLHRACQSTRDHGKLKCTESATVLEGFTGIAVRRVYLTSALEQVADAGTPLACYYGDDGFVSFALQAAGAKLRVAYDSEFNIIMFNKHNKQHDFGDKTFCVTSKVPGLSGSCPNNEAYALCESWFSSKH